SRSAPGPWRRAVRTASRASSPPTPGCALKHALWRPRLLSLASLQRKCSPQEETSMQPKRGSILRTIAEHELEACFGQLNPVTKHDLATSLVRQWLTNGGQAVIVTREYHLWFRM